MFHISEQKKIEAIDNLLDPWKYYIITEKNFIKPSLSFTEEETEAQTGAITRW